MVNYMEKTKHKVICPKSKGNGYLRLPYHLTKEEITVQCDMCKSQGEIILNEEDFVEQFVKPN